MNLRKLINGLEQLSCGGANDNLEVVFRLGPDWQTYPEITSAKIAQDPDYNFDEANCGPEKWVELDIDDEERECFGLDRK